MQAMRMRAQSAALCLARAVLMHSHGSGCGRCSRMCVAEARTGRIHMQAQLHALRAVIAHRARHKVLARPAGRHLHLQRRHIGLPGHQAARTEVARRFTLHPHVVELRVVRKYLRMQGSPSAPGASGRRPAPPSAAATGGARRS